MIRDDLYVDLKTMQTRQCELEKKLAVARLMANARPNRPGPLARVLDRLGDALILVGQALKARYDQGYPGSGDFASGAG